MRRHLGILLAALLLGGCASNAAAPVAHQGDAVPPVPMSLRLTGHGSTAIPQVLSMVPDRATTLTITDFDAIRARLGFHTLSSDDSPAERTAFWERARRETVLLTDGLLRRHEAALLRDFGFTQDDVDWEARFSGPDTKGWVMSLRPGLDMARVRAAVRAGIGPLKGAKVLPRQHLVVRGVAVADEVVWAQHDELVPLLDPEAESAYVSRECVPFDSTLGAGVPDQVRAGVLAAYDVRFLRPLEAWSVTFTDHLVTAWFDRGRVDLHDRADLSKVWPRTLGFGSGFSGLAVADPGTGRIGHRIADPRAAARLTLSGGLPFAVCNEASRN